MKWNKGIEMCQFCKISYHPMTRWKKGSDVVFIHEFIFKVGFSEIQLDDKCKKIAAQRGYTERRDLTPTR